MKYDNEYLQSKVKKVFKHHSGKEYTLIGVSNLKATKPDYPKLAIYVDNDMVIWSRPIEDFLEKFEETKESWPSIKL